ncbi:MAG: methionine biosynthesis protein MetW [Micropruina sp.]|uniref:methionine biosynthesis protein MetW n=1 Tax=Micropruina sp. TaxID=2737536 RepID=UPI0039E614D4
MNLRPDLNLIAHLVPNSSRVLDLGCGKGSLLRHLIAEHNCTGTGVEIDPEKVLTAITAGVPVMELDLDADLGLFAAASYDTVVLSRTIQTIRRPEVVLREMARIGSRLIVSVPNFGLLQHRLMLLRGRMPMSRELPYSWYDTPNLRFTTLVDLEDLFAKLGLMIEQRINLSLAGEPLGKHLRAANLRAGAAVYVLGRG